MSPQPKNFRHIRGALYAQPWAITQEWLATITEIYERHANGDTKAVLEAVQKLKPDGMGRVSMVEQELDIRDGIAVVCLDGPLFPKANLMTALSGATSLEEFTNEFKEALESPDVDSILINASSPGGSVNGTAEAASVVFSARGIKPVICLADGHCCSGAYWIGSQADEFFATEGSMVGSIGVLMQMDNWDRAERNAGNDPLILRSNELKAPGNGPLTPSQINSMQRVLNSYFQQFKDAVTRARAGIEIDTVATGEVWIGQEAVDVGLADEVSTLDKIIERYGVRETVLA